MGYFGATFGRPVDEGQQWLEDTIEPNSDLWATVDESRGEIVALYHRAWAHADATIDALPLEAPGHVPWWQGDRGEVTLHLILVHVIAETHRHAGHADIVRELIDGAAGLRPGHDNLPPGVDARWWGSTATGSRPLRRMLLRRQRRRARPTVESEVSGLGELGGQPDVVVADGLAVGEQLTVVVEEDHAVAQQAPALLGVAADHGGEVTRLAGGLGAGRYVGTHGGPFVRWFLNTGQITDRARLFTGSASLTAG
jgi:uncharacterized protein DUF664